MKLEFSKKNILIAGGLALFICISLIVALLFFKEEGGDLRSGEETGQDKPFDPEEHPGMTEAEIKEIRGAPDELTARHSLDRKRILTQEAEDYRQRARFPHYSLPISRQNDPVRNEFTPSQPLTRHPDQPNGPFMVQYLDKNSFEPNEPLVIHAFLLNEEKEKLEARDLQATLTIGGAAGRVLANLDMRDDGSPGDTAGDLIYTASFRLPSDLQQADARPTNYVVIVKSGKMIETNAFSVGYLNIAHTGNYSDRIEADAKGNHLTVDVEFNVKRAGSFHLQASLYSLEGEAIGWAQNRVNLETGKQTISLKFYGKLLCDARVSGPYILKHMAYMNVAAMPGVRSQLITDSYRTAEYLPAQFTCASFDDPEYMARAAQAEHDAQEAGQ